MQKMKLMRKLLSTAVEIAEATHGRDRGTKPNLTRTITLRSEGRVLDRLSLTHVLHTGGDDKKSIQVKTVPYAPLVGTAFEGLFVKEVLITARVWEKSLLFPTSVYLNLYAVIASYSEKEASQLIQAESELALSEIAA